MERAELCTPTSVSLLRRYQGGDEAALNDLLTRYLPRLERIVRARLGTRLRTKVEAQDVMQEVLMHASAGLKDFEAREDAGVIQWMARIVENEIIRLDRHFGAQKRNINRESPIDAPRSGASESGLLLRLEADSVSPLSKAAQREVELVVDECLSQLPEAYREVIILRDWVGGSWEFVAEEIQSPTADSAKHLYRRAIAKLAVAFDRSSSS